MLHPLYKEYLRHFTPALETWTAYMLGARDFERSTCGECKSVKRCWMTPEEYRVSVIKYINRSSFAYVQGTLGISGERLFYIIQNAQNMFEYLCVN